MSSLAVIQEVYELNSLETVLALKDFHVWSAATVHQRFDYRQPGLFLLLCRMYRLSTPIEIADSPAFAGCRSWVPLETELSTGGLSPILSDAEFDRQRAEIGQLINGLQ